MRLALRGFQSHDETSLDLRGGLVCVTGPNNVGKSAIVRAARWLFYDALRGTKFVRKGVDLASVEAEIGGRRVARVKSRKAAGRNAYEVDGGALESIGTGAPPEVEEATGIRRAVIDKDLELELNVVRQKEHPFLMEETGTAKAKILNALTGLHVLDVAIRATAAALRGLVSGQKSLAESRESLLRELSAYSDLPAKEAAVASARGSLEASMARAAKVREGRLLLYSHLAAAKERDRLAAIRVPDTAEMESLLDFSSSLSARRDGMRSALDHYAECSRRARSLASDPVSMVNAADIDALLARHEALSSEAASMRGRYNEFQSLRTQWRAAEAQRSHTQSALEQAEKELESFLGKPCPECGRPIDSDCLAEAM